MSRTFALVWNPREFDWDKSGLRSDLAKIKSSGFSDNKWSCGWSGASGSRGPQPGDRFYLFRVGPECPGLMAAGRFRTRPDKKNGSFNGAPLAKIKIEYIADYKSPDRFLGRNALRLLTGDLLNFKASGMPIRETTAFKLEILLALICSNVKLPARMPLSGS